jgi:hypothetical protein
MSVYQSLRQDPPKLVIKENAREVIFKTISCMCDNVHYITLKKNTQSEFEMRGSGHSGMGYSLSNWQFNHQPHEITWAADENNWSDVIKMINSGTALIAEVKSR